jgi:hypothetical protein
MSVELNVHVGILQDLTAQSPTKLSPLSNMAVERLAPLLCAWEVLFRVSPRDSVEVICKFPPFLEGNAEIAP